MYIGMTRERVFCKSVTEIVEVFPYAMPYSGEIEISTTFYRLISVFGEWQRFQGGTTSVPSSIMEQRSQVHLYDLLRFFVDFVRGKI